MNNWFEKYQVNPIYGWGLTKRWIVHGGFAANDQLTISQLAQEVRRKAEKEKCVYIEIRCYDDYSAYRKQLEHAGYTYVPHYDVTIDPQKEVPDAKMRQIRRAQEEGLRWREAKSEKDWKEWYSKLRCLYWFKIRRPLPSYGFFHSLYREKKCHLLVVKKDRKCVGGVLLVVEDDKSKAYEWYICGQVMSTWAAIEYCRQQGIQCFDTMGAGEPGVPYGVRDFKLQMGGELHEWGRYLCVLRPMWYKIGKWVIELFK